ncbi:MAG: hypothetical protein U9N81_14930 [Bacillota bacterium]|nr:hypothetical protein [Bacillota bacterium]
MENNLELLMLPPSVLGSKEWTELEHRENQIGSEALFSDIIEKQMWSNVEIAWVLKQLVYYYGKKDALLKKAPVDRLFTNMVDILRVFFLFFDAQDAEIDDNMRQYISSKLADATWGVNARTREYLRKL